MSKATCKTCPREAHCRGYCTRCYWRLRKHGDPLGSSPGQKAPRFEPTDDLENSKVCSKCKFRLPREAFHKLSKSKDGLQPRCRNCYRDWYNERYQANPEFREKRGEHFAKFYEETYPSRREKQNNAKLFKMYGITREQFTEMSAAQGDVCRICKRPPQGKTRLSVDHVHETGQVRGLLCDPCNTGLGMFGDDPERLSAAIRYLADSKPGQLPLFAA